MKNNYTFILFSLYSLFSFFPAGILSAQKVWTLSDCIQYALENNIDVKRQKIQLEKQAIEVQTQQMSRLPDLGVNGTQKFDFGRSLNRENTYNDMNSQSSSFSLSTELPLFTGMKTTHIIALQKLELKVHAKNLEKIENDIALQIAVNYFQILLNKEILAIAKEQITLSKELEEITQILALHGKAPESQVYDVQAQVANDELNATKAQSALRLSVVDLIQLLEIKEVGGFDIATIQEDIASFFIRNPQEVYTVAEQIMPEIKGAELSAESSRKAIKIAQSGYYPALSFVAGISSNYYHYSNMENSAFGRQFENNLQKTLYLTLRIPLFNRLSTRNAVRTARKNWEDSRLIAEQTHKTLYKEIQKACYDALSAQEKYESTQKAVYANSEALRYAREKYNAGKFTAYEYNEIKLKSANSQSEQAQAKYECMLQKKLLDFYAGIPIQ
ncbi:MAG: TolC family protein [Tannerellaceae bacterium]|jgi:outer membrane protein|nr:TolC family protein [Tannerellaceae bacterium]